MPYTIYKSDGSMLVDIQDNTIDNISSDLYLVGQNAINYGQYLDQNFINLLERFSNSSAPAIPLQGQLWYDTALKSLKVYNGVLWDVLTPTFDGVAGILIDLIDSDNIYSKVLYTVSNSKIVSATSDIPISYDILPTSISVNDIVIPVKENFPAGLIAGITFVTVSNVNVSVNSDTVSTAKFSSNVNISLSGMFTGNVLFDGSSNVNISVVFGNVYIGNTNVTVAGQYSNVTVDSTGYIKNVGNITYSDVVGSLTYIPFNSANVSVANLPNNLILRDANSNFYANTMTGAVQFAETLINGPKITISGDIEGYSNAIVGNSNVVIQTVRSMSNVAEGVYSTVSVNDRGQITSGVFLENIPIGTVALYTNSVVPEGWARCDGGVITTPDGAQIVTPNLSNVIVGGASYIIKAYSDKYLPSNDSIIGTLSVSLAGGNVPYVSFIGGPYSNYPPLVMSNVKVGNTASTITSPFSISDVQLVSRGSGYTVGQKLFIKDEPFIQSTDSYRSSSSGAPSKSTVEAELTVTSVDGAGAVTALSISTGGSYKDLIKMHDVQLPRSPTSGSAPAKANFKLTKKLPPSVTANSSDFVDIDFGEDLFFDATSLALANGDPNAVFLSQLNIYGELKNLTISQILGNLKVRINSQLPGRLGKYMLSYDDILYYSNRLQFNKENTYFTTAVQNRLMYAKISDFANKFAVAGFYPTDDKLFGASVIGYERYLAIFTAPRNQIVLTTLTLAGYEPLQFSDNDYLPNVELLTYFSKIITNSKVAISNNRVSQTIAADTNKLSGTRSLTVPNALVQTSTFTTSNVNIVVSSVVIDGLPAIIGSNVSTQPGGGSFATAGGDINNVIYNLVNQQRNSTITANDPWHPNDGPIGGTSGGSGGGSGGGSNNSSTKPGTGTPTTPSSTSGTGSVSNSGIVNNPSTQPTTGNNAPPTAGSPPGTAPSGVSGVMVSNNMAVPNSTGVPNKETINLVSASVPAGYVAQVTPAGGKHERTAGTQNHPSGYAADVALVDKNGNPAPVSAYQGYVETAASYVGTNGGIEIAMTANGGINFVHANTAQGSGRTLMINHPALSGTSFQNGNINRLIGTEYQYVYDQAVKAGLVAAYNSGVKKASGVVPPAAPPAPPPTSTITTGGTLPNAVPPMSAALVQTAATVTKTVVQLTNVAEAAVVVVQDLIKTGVATVVGVAGIISKINSAVSGIQPPVAKSPTTTGTSGSTPAKPSTSTSGGSYNPSTSGSGGGGADSGQAANKPSTSGTISGVSASNNGSISVAAAPASRPSTTATYGVSNTVSKPTSGGTGTTSKPSPPAAGSGCFVYETAIDMADGTTKPIGTIRLGDQTRGGEVVAIHCYDGAPLYDYLGVHVSGTHYVIENGVPIMVQDSVHAVKINDVYGLYTIDTTGRRIFANGIEFADHNGDGVIFEFFKNAEKTVFESTEEIYHEILTQVKNAKI